MGMQDIIINRLSDLKNLPQWVCYTFPEKKPINPHTGYGADCNKPETWGTFDQAWLTRAKSNGLYPGVGFEFVKEQGLTGVDLDKCVVDGELTDWAKEVLERLNSYAEF